MLESNDVKIVELYRQKKTGISAKANGYIVILDLVKIAFTIWEKDGNLFPSFPSRSYVNKEGKTVWVNQVEILDEDDRNLIFSLILKAYNNNEVDTVKPAVAQPNKEEGVYTPPEEKKPKPISHRLNALRERHIG